MSNQERTKQIIDAKQRASSGWFGAHALESLDAKWRSNQDKSGCEPDFYVIRAVTLLEVFTRRNLAGAIDHDRIFTERAIEFSRHVKIDFALVHEIQGKTITLGDVLAHSVPVNSFGQIIGYFETLLGKAIRPLLEAAVDRWDTEVMKEPRAPIIADYATMARSLSRLFEVRHILCHEAPRKRAYEVSEVDAFLEHASQLARALDEILTLERFGLVPLTQTDMNVAASEELASAETEMNVLLSAVEDRVRLVESQIETFKRDTDPSYSSSLSDAQQKWAAYRNAQCDFETYLNNGGTIQPLLWANGAMQLTRLRISELQRWLHFDSETR